MVNVAQIPNLPAAIALNGTELFEAVQAGVSVRVSTDLLASYLQLTPLAALTVSSPLQRAANNISLTTVPATLGGTGLSSYVAGDMLYADTTSTLAALADVATGNVLLSGGVGVAPAWGKVNLSAAVSSILPVANGGTAVATTTANIVFAGPAAGGAAAPGFRALVTADLPAGSGTLTAPIIFPSRVVVAAGTTTMAGSDFEVIINKTIAVANAVTLPASPVLGQIARVSDGKGDAFTNNITISPAAGTINGATTVVMNTNYGCFTFRYSGTEWNVIF